MIVYPIRSSLVKSGDSITELFSKALAKNRARLKNRDIVAVSSKIVGIAENRIRQLDNVRPRSEARRLSRRYSLTPAFAQAVLDEADIVVGGVRGALLTVKNGDAVANAGIDRKNAPEGSVVLWPRNADLSARNIGRSIRRMLGKNVGVVIVDSRVSPMRLGTTGFAIGCTGFEAIEDIRGTVDLFGRRMEITVRAIADGIAASAQLVMGEASELIPFAIVRGAPVSFGDGHGIRVAKLAWNRCLYMNQIPRANG
ncbi:coenzyme F420-0:L-glutamate ligase [archaeon 13_2_20CM_2_52_21]|nr:MAG: coenzyme F420-0:L-glutamate ligase [archaeon 13_2_20CM_2_52_21]OLD08901.1 MAG: coenzyme F420-0:L-glutamate ligase [Crenarchaeota archaeon 13_1_40CM_3_52_4]OLD44877.1 MAG: coenzyme F420-0:L-glutamate ligase [archaeon 13_1_40CM_2_52_4]